jgi:hypothetical protein
LANPNYDSVAYTSDGKVGILHPPGKGMCKHDIVNADGIQSNRAAGQDFLTFKQHYL